MDIKINVTIDIGKTVSHLKNAADKAVFPAAKKALSDSDYYCKQDHGTLISSHVHSKIEKGILCWKTPYAKLQYYLDAAKTDINPNARKMWAHYAESVHGKDWNEVYQKAFREYAKEE